MCWQQRAESRGRGCACLAGRTSACLAAGGCCYEWGRCFEWRCVCPCPCAPAGAAVGSGGPHGYPGGNQLGGRRPGTGYHPPKQASHAWSRSFAPAVRPGLPAGQVPPRAPGPALRALCESAPCPVLWCGAGHGWRGTMTLWKMWCSGLAATSRCPCVLECRGVRACVHMPPFPSFTWGACNPCPATLIGSPTRPSSRTPPCPLGAAGQRG